MIEFISFSSSSSPPQQLFHIAYSMEDEEEEESITSGNWIGKHNSLSRGAGADQPQTSRGIPSPLELPHYDEHYVPTLPRFRCHALSTPVVAWVRPLFGRRMDPLLSRAGGRERHAPSSPCFDGSVASTHMVTCQLRPPHLWTDGSIVVLGQEVESRICCPLHPALTLKAGGGPHPAWTLG